MKLFQSFVEDVKCGDSKKETTQYELWKATHNCSINHIESSGSMESAGAINIFNRSVEKNSIIYEYLGDGDSFSFKEVIESEPYKAYNIMPEKLGCIGHAQKRMGTRFCNIVKSHKGTNKTIHGRNKLTESVINSMQNYYGLAIRNNVNNLFAMKKAVGPILYHCTDFADQNSRHLFCPKTEDT